MRTNLPRTIMTIPMTFIGLAALFAPGAMACGSLTLATNPGGAFSGLAMPHLVEPNHADGPPRDWVDSKPTGLWKTVLTSGGTVVMVEFDTWHSDGTEIALDGLFPPATGNVCPGVWERTGPHTYSTVHPAFEYDNAGVNVIAIFIERMQVTLSPDGNSMQGTFTWDNYDFHGTLLPGSVNGTVAAKRITADSPFPFPFPF